MNRFVVVTSILILVLPAAGGCRNGGKARPTGDSAAETPRVHVEQPKRESLSFAITRPGYLQAYEQTPLHPKVEGYVGKTRQVKDKHGKVVDRDIADIGDRVKEGEVLAEILVPELVEEYAQEVAQVKQAEVGVSQADDRLIAQV